MNKKVRTFLKSQIHRKHETVDSLAGKIGIGYGTLYRFLRDGSVGTIRVKNSLEDYYNKAMKNVSV